MNLLEREVNLIRFDEGGGGGPIHELGSGEITHQIEWVYSNLRDESDRARYDAAIEKAVIPSIGEANVVAEQIESEQYRKIRNRMESLGSSNVEMAMVGCIDGRLYSVLQVFPRLTSFLKTPAGLVGGVRALVGRVGRRVLPPRIYESIRQRVKKGKTFIEVLSAHGSNHRGHGCGAHKAMYPDRVGIDLDGGIKHDLTRPERDNTRRLFKDNVLAIDAFINTDTQGIVLFGEGMITRIAGEEDCFVTQEYVQQEHLNKALFSTADFVKGHRETLSSLSDGLGKVDWDKPENLVSNLDRIVSLAERIDMSNLGREIEEHLGRMFGPSEFTPDVRRELKSHLMYNIAVIHLSNFLDSQDSPARYRDHSERFAVVGDKGFDFSPGTLPFLISTSEGDEIVQDNIRVMASLLPGILEKQHGVSLENEAMVVYISAPIFVGTTGKIDGETRGRVIETLTRQYSLVARTLAGLNMTQEDGKVLIVPVIVDQKTRRVMEIPDLSSYL